MLIASLLDTIYTPMIQSMQTSEPWGAPQGPFYLLQGDVAPKVPRPTMFSVTCDTDRVGQLLNIGVSRVTQNTMGVDIRSTSNYTQIVIAATTFSIPVQLAGGSNQVAFSYAIPPTETAYCIVNVTNIVTAWEAFARVLYSYSTNIIDEQQQAIYSTSGTRLMEPFLSFTDLLPEIQSLQVLATRLSARGLIHEVGNAQGVTDLYTALCTSTPVYRPMERDTFDLYPSTDPFANVASQYSGLEAHCWMPNIGVAGWIAFIGYISNQPDIFQIVDINEEQIAFIYQGNLQIHEFDFDAYGADFLNSLSQSQCFKSITVTMTMSSVIDILICAAAYTFDLFIVSTKPIGRGRISFDDGVLFDQGLSFDSDDIDPWSEGWVGLSLVGRLDEGHYLDTFFDPSSSYPGSACGYNGYFSQVVENQMTELELSAVAYINYASLDTPNDMLTEDGQIILAENNDDIILEQP